MHSRKKVPKDENKEKERLQKATKFSGALKKILQMKNNGCKDKGLLDGIASLLEVSPDFYTLWNYRREILIALKEELDNADDRNNPRSETDLTDNSQINELDKLCRNELFFIEKCLKVNYKSYGTWHHRCWLLTFMDEPDLDREIQLCNQFLQMDGRNFHCWNYRRFVVNLAKIDPVDELSFTKAKINDDSFSNFSSWFYRSSLLKQLYATEQKCDLVRASVEDDYTQMMNAIYTDPTDQSAWLYLRWLFSLYSNGLESLSNKANLHSSVQIRRFFWTSSLVVDQFLFGVELSTYSPEKPSICLTINGQPVELSDWNATNGYSWYCRAGFKHPFEDNNQYSFELKSECSKSSETLVKAAFNLAKENNSNFVCFNYFGASHEGQGIKIGTEKYQLVQDLLELEPDNKWVNFTLAWLESNDDFMNSAIDKLIQIDNLRVNYYKDLRSKIVLRKHLSGQKTLLRSLHLSLSGLKLHSLCDTSRLMHLQYLDLSHNELIKLGVTFSPLVSLKCLLLNSNSIYVVDEKLRLPNLTILSLANNRITKWHIIDIVLSNFMSLKHLALFGNPIQVEDRLDRDLLQSKIASRDLVLYLDQTNESETNTSRIVEAEFEVIQKRHADEAIQL